jgi:hypothetical protein
MGLYVSTEALLRTLHLDQFYGSETGSSTLEWKSGFLRDIVLLSRAFQPNIDLRSFIERYNLEILQFDPTDPFKGINMERISKAAYCADGRNFFISEKYVGLGPCLIREGDLICTILGCSYPVILRRKVDGYKKIGEDYVDGMMYGKAMEGFRKGVYARQTFALR